MFNPFTRKSVSKELLDDIVMELQKYKDMKFYTCHCTGKTAFDYLSHHMNIIYLAEKLLKFNISTNTTSVY